LDPRGLREGRGDFWVTGVEKDKKQKGRRKKGYRETGGGGTRKEKKEGKKEQPISGACRRVKEGERKA